MSDQNSSASSDVLWSSDDDSDTDSSGESLLTDSFIIADRLSRAKMQMYTNLNLDDVESMIKMEKECLTGQGHTKEELCAYVRQRPCEQYMLCSEETQEMACFCLTLRTQSIEHLKTLSMERLREGANSTGPVLVIVALVSYRRGDLLLDAVLKEASRLPGVRTVVAVSRCCFFDEEGYKVNWNYSDYVNLEKDPGISYHTRRGGKILQIMPGWNVRDTPNQSNGVLIKYADNYDELFGLLLAACRRVHTEGMCQDPPKIHPCTMNMLRIAVRSSELEYCLKLDDHEPLPDLGHGLLVQACSVVHKTRGSEESLKLLQGAVEKSDLMREVHGGTGWGDETLPEEQAASDQNLSASSEVVWFSDDDSENSSASSEVVWFIDDDSDTDSRAAPLPQSRAGHLREAKEIKEEEEERRKESVDNTPPIGRRNTRVAEAAQPITIDDTPPLARRPLCPC